MSVCPECGRDCSCAAQPILVPICPECGRDCSCAAQPILVPIAHLSQRDDGSCLCCSRLSLVTMRMSSGWGGTLVSRLCADHAAQLRRELGELL